LSTALTQLCSDHAGCLLVIQSGSIEDQSAFFHLNDAPSLTGPSVNLVPPTLLTIHAPIAAPIQDMTVTHRTKVDAAIVRIMKKHRIVRYSDLVAQLSTVLDFLPEVL
jgi:hypothetical protein